MLRAEIGDIGRFPTPAHLASYAGVVPQVDSSASRTHKGGTTKDDRRGCGGRWSKSACRRYAVAIGSDDGAANSPCAKGR